MEMGKLKTHSPIYSITDNRKYMLDLTHTLDKIYLTGILWIQCPQISLMLLMIRHHRFKSCLGTEKSTNHYLKYLWPLKHTRVISDASISCVICLDISLELTPIIYNDRRQYILCIYVVIQGNMSYRISSIYWIRSTVITTCHYLWQLVYHTQVHRTLYQGNRCAFIHIEGTIYMTNCQFEGKYTSWYSILHFGLELQSSKSAIKLVVAWLYLPMAHLTKMDKFLPNTD